MGNETSKELIDDATPPETLESRSVEAIAKYIKEKNIRRIVVLTGAGISTAAGIPDFRSPDTGIYANLARLNLPEPEAVFDISYFRQNPLPFYALARDMFPGQYKPTLTHCFIKLLYNKGRLLKLFTQNIDCLEREAGVPGEMIVEAHGSFASHSCIECKAEYPDDLMRKAIEKDDVPLCLECQGLVKPDIVFFGEALPSSFFMNRTLTAAADLCIIMGTSLKVFPFAGLPSLCKEGVPRLLINLDRVGGLGSRPDDVLLLGECDDGVMRLAEALGWREELEALFAEINPDKAGVKIATVEGPPPTRDERLRDEVDRLTEEIDHTLHLSRTHEQRTRDELRAKEIKEENPQEETTSDKLRSSASEKTKGEAKTEAHTDEDGKSKQEAQSREKYESSSPESPTLHYLSKESTKDEEEAPGENDPGKKPWL